MSSTIARLARPLPSVRRGDSAVLFTVIGVALATWVVTAVRMWGMDGGPGTDLGGIGWYLGVWLTTMAAMMLPAVTPFAVSFSRISDERRRTGSGFVPTWALLAGYLGAWTIYGLVAYGVYRPIRGADPHFLRWDAQGPYVAGAVVVVAGLYEFTSLKSACLNTCRTPLQFILHRWRNGRVGAFVMGLEHGAVCVGCCWALFALLFAIGVMSILWMALVTALVFIQRTLPGGDRITPFLGAILVAFGIWIAVSPASVPGLTQPGSGMGTRGGTHRPMTSMPATSMNPKPAPAKSMNQGAQP
jgi:predicted metal-binding membrane protein